MSKNERKNIGKKGMKWALGNEAGFTSKHQADRFIDAIEETIILSNLIEDLKADIRGYNESI